MGCPGVTKNEISSEHQWIFRKISWIVEIGLVEFVIIWLGSLSNWKPLQATHSGGVIEK